MAKIAINKSYWVNTMPRSPKTAVRGEPGEGLQRLGDLAHGTKVQGKMIYEGSDPETNDDDWVEIVLPATGFTPITNPMPAPNRAPFVKLSFLSETDPNAPVVPPVSDSMPIAVKVLLAFVEAGAAAVRGLFK
jgi:hypothetical protein